MEKLEVHLLKVFVDKSGQFGDSATVVFDIERKLSTLHRKEIARQLCTDHGAVETVFVNDVSARALSIVHQQGEINFAGGPALGTAWLLSQMTDKPIDRMESQGSEIIVSYSDNMFWVQASLDAMPPWHHIALDTNAAVESITLAETQEWEHTMAWAWVDEEKGIVRARTFAPDWDIPEVQGNGSGSMMLSAHIGREITICHGAGSMIFARPDGQRHAYLGGSIRSEKRYSPKLCHEA